jgi:plasmid stabilization system protein ParE
MAKKSVVKSSANFECNLDEIEHFLAEAGAPRAFAGLLDDLLDTVIPNLQRFPRIGHPFLSREAGSIEASDARRALAARLAALTPEADALCEYVLKDYLVLYVAIGEVIYLLAIRHQRQLSFDFDGQWGRSY